MIQQLTRILYLSFILIPLFFSYSCGDKKRNIFNASRKQVDSNLVVINNPLTLPPFFFLPETKNSKVTDSIDKISKSNSDAILNSPAINNNANLPITNTDKEFLNLVGYNKAKKDIREVLDKEINSLVEKDKTFIDKLFNYFQSNSNNEKSDNNENKTANKIE
jgi:hypothetical protein